MPMAILFKQIPLFTVLPLSLLSLFLLFRLLANHQPHRFSQLPKPFPPPPKVAYFISGTNNDGPRIFRLLQATYHPRNYYLLHLDRRASDKQRDRLARIVGSVEIFVAAGNVNVMKKSNPVNEEGSSPLALILHGAAILSRWKKDWDWFVNLAASDYPLIPQDDFLHILSYLPRELNFIEHETNITMQEYQRITDVIVDPRLYLQSAGRMFMGSEKRTIPNAFRFLTGSPHVILNHKLVQFALLGWENFPRILLLYFSNTRLSHKAYFQTLACNSEFSRTVINSNLRYTDCNSPCSESRQSGRPMDFGRMLASGAAFAGNFSVNDPIMDVIDSVVLNRGKGMPAPGAWCLGRSWSGRVSCSEWGDVDILRPGPAARRFKLLLLKLMKSKSFRSDFT
ncbi:beta-glucuronosyltransferase GlcAT14A [Coffea arabica]|uniref:Beta-glucuronosyltransferase GlcAT14A n=1 Tax=Coffea arabica TaxID=13443 RepID=A0A6P6VPQ6_COFAR|nr:beta-glucuronosyltransferase GlcAT14A-like [Coffea arabica]XP_027104536.1 beta-glucuronosyltransferase GlcAT14A-like [Coffea arabica]